VKCFRIPEWACPEGRGVTRGRIELLSYDRRYDPGPDLLGNTVPILSDLNPLTIVANCDAVRVREVDGFIVG
jgi:hypothetical protein